MLRSPPWVARASMAEYARQIRGWRSETRRLGLRCTAKGGRTGRDRENSLVKDSGEGLWSATEGEIDAKSMTIWGIPDKSAALREAHPVGARVTLQGEQLMTPAIAAPASGIAIPVRALLPWAVFVGTLALLLIYFIGAEGGATSLIAGHTIHEFVHDGRHLLGFPCH
jgi:putative cobalt transporter subunit CbtB